MAEIERVILGAGDWYVGDYTSGALDLDAIAIAANFLGNTQGGATIEYTPSTYTVEDDMGRVRKVFQTKADATMKTGLLTYLLQDLYKVLSVGTKTTPATGKTRLELPAGKSYLRRKAVVFVYTDDETGDTLKVGMVAVNTGALSMAFAKDKETVPELTFTAESHGDSGVLIVFEETEG